jgi:hypothetical protein
MKGSRIRNYNANIRLAAERGRAAEPRAVGEEERQSEGTRFRAQETL